MSRDPHRALLEVLADYLGPLSNLTARTFDWASATFIGMRHEIAFTCDASEALVDALPDIELPMSGHFVADLRVNSLRSVTGRMHVALEALTIREDISANAR